MKQRLITRRRAHLFLWRYAGSDTSYNMMDKKTHQDDAVEYQTKNLDNLSYHWDSLCDTLLIVVYKVIEPQLLNTILVNNTII